MAKHCLDTFNGAAMPVPDLPTKVYFRLNMAIGPTKTAGEEYALFIGDIGREVNDHMLYSLFREKYPSVKSAKVSLFLSLSLSLSLSFSVLAPNFFFCYVPRWWQILRLEAQRDMDLSASMTALIIRGMLYFLFFYFSFSSFLKKRIVTCRALGEMQGYHVGSRAIRVAAGNSNSAKGTGSGSNPGQSSSSSSSNFEPPNPNEYSQTNIYVSGFPPGMTEHDVGPFFVEFGELSSVKVLPGRGVGFIHYAHPNAAEAAMRRMQGAMIGGAPVKLAFAKLSNNARQSSGGGYNNPFGMYQGVSSFFLFFLFYL